jgi:hypothetical protein
MDVPSDLGPVLWALRFNSYFDIFTAKNFTFDSEGLLDLAETFKYNKTIKKIILSNVGASHSSMTQFFANLGQNQGNSVRSLDISDNSIEDKV